MDLQNWNKEKEIIIYIMTYTHWKALLKIFVIMSMSYSHSEEGTIFFAHKEKDTVYFLE